MRKAFLTLRWVVFCFLALCLIASGTAVFLLKTEYGKGLVLSFVEDVFNRSFEGTLQIGSIDAMSLSGLKATNVLLLFHGRRVLSIKRLKGDISPMALFAKRVWIPKLSFEGVLFDLARNDHGQPAVSQAFRPRKPEGKKGPPSAWRVRIARFEVKNGCFIDSALLIDQARFLGHFSLFRDNIRLDVSDLSARLFMQKKEHTIQAAMTYSYKDRTHTLVLLPSTLARERSCLRVHGNIRLAPAFSMELGVGLEHAFLSDFKHLFVLPGVSVTYPLEGGVGFYGDLKTFRVGYGLISGASRIFGTLKADLRGKEPELQADLREVLLGSKDVRLPRDVPFSFAGSGWLKLRGLSGIPKEGQASVHFERVSVQGLEVRDVHASIKKAGDALRIHAEAKDSRGEASVEGNVTLTSEKHFTATFSFGQINPSAWRASLPAGRLFGKGSIQGEFPKAKDSRFSFSMSLLPQSQIGGVHGIRAEARGSWMPDALRLDLASVTAGPNMLSLKGNLEPKTLRSADINFSLAAKDLSVLSGPLRIPLQGSMYANGMVKKQEKRFFSKGRLSGESLRVATYQAEKLDGSWDGSLHEGQPQGSFRASIQEVQAGIGFRNVRILANGAQTFNVSLEASDSCWEGSYRLKTRIALQREGFHAMLDSFQMKSPKANWRLAKPADLTVSFRGGFWVEKLELTDGGQVLLLEGGANKEKANVSLTLSGVQLGTVLDLLNPSFQSMEAEVNGRVEVVGNPYSPILKAKASIKDLRYGKRSYGDLHADIDFSNNLATVNASWPSQKTHVIVRQPLEFSLVRGVQIRFKRGLWLEAHSEGISLGLLEPFVGERLTSIAGVAQFHVLLAGGGTEGKAIKGLFAIQDGYVRMAGYEAEAIFDEFQVNFLGKAMRVLIKAHDPEGGRLALNGTIGLHGMEPPDLDIRLAARTFSISRVAKYRIKSDADLTLTGNTRSPSLQGEVVFLQSIINPELGLLAKKGITQDKTVVVHRTEGSTVERVARRPTAVFNPIHSLRMDVRLRIAEDVLVQRTDVTANLRGNVRLHKEAGGPVKLEGSLEVSRGWLSVYSKRFTIERAKATFTEATGLNPLLDIISVYTKKEYTVYVLVRGEAKRPQVEFKSAPELDKTDILSVLLFGKPQSELGSSEQASFQSQAAAASGGMIASTLLSGFRQEFGVSGLGFQIEEFSMANENGDGGRIGLGRYIGPKTYVRFYHSLNHQEGEEVAVDYHLTPKLGVSAHTTSIGTNGVDVFLHTQY